MFTSRFHQMCKYQGFHTTSLLQGKYLYFWVGKGSWIISSTYEDSKGLVAAKSDVECPAAAADWTVWDGSSWSSEHPVTVTEHFDVVLV